MDDYYRTLGLTPSASELEIKQAWRDLARIWHPDRFSHDPRLQARAVEELKKINEAYEVLIKRGAAARRDLHGTSSASDTNDLHKPTPKTTKSQTNERSQQQAKARPSPTEQPSKYFNSRRVTVSLLVATILLFVLIRLTQKDELPTPGVLRDAAGRVLIPQYNSRPVELPSIVIRAQVSHVISTGESLAGISKRYGVTVAEIVDANKLTTGRRLRVGQKLQILSRYYEHVVQEGETLLGIATRYSTQTSEIRQLNRMEARAKLMVGQRLKIPYVVSPEGR